MGIPKLASLEYDVKAALYVKRWNLADASVEKTPLPVTRSTDPEPSPKYPQSALIAIGYGESSTHASRRF